MHNSADTKTCPRCGRVRPAAEFVSKTFGPTSECTECLWERMCQVPEVDSFDFEEVAARHRSSQETNPEVLRRGYRRYYGDDREKILERVGRCFTAKGRHRHLLTQAETGYVRFGARMRKRRARRHEAGGSYTIEDVQRLYDEQGGCCFYCRKELNGIYELDHKTPLGRGGTDWPENLCCACVLCASAKDKMTAEEFMEYLTNLRRRP